MPISPMPIRPEPIRFNLSSSGGGACSGAAATGAEAEALAKALCRAGVVLRHRDTVFLRPEEVAAAVLQVGGIMMRRIL